MLLQEGSNPMNPKEQPAAVSKNRNTFIYTHPLSPQIPQVVFKTDRRLLGSFFYFWYQESLL